MTHKSFHTECDWDEENADDISNKDFESVDKIPPQENTELFLQNYCTSILPGSDINMTDVTESHLHLATKINCNIEVNTKTSPQSSSDIQIILSSLIESACLLVEKSNGVNFDNSDLSMQNTDSTVSTESFANNNTGNCQVLVSCKNTDATVENNVTSKTLTTSIKSGKEIVLDNCLFTTSDETKTFVSTNSAKKSSTPIKEWTFVRKSPETSVNDLTSKVCVSSSSFSSKHLKVENATDLHCLKTFNEVSNSVNYDKNTEYLSDVKGDCRKFKDMNSHANPSGLSEKSFCHKEASSVSDVLCVNVSEENTSCNLTESLDANVDILLKEAPQVVSSEFSDKDVLQMDPHESISSENADVEFMQTSAIESFRRIRKNAMGKRTTFSKNSRQNSKLVHKFYKSGNLKRITSSKTVSQSVINSKRKLNRNMFLKNKPFKKIGSIKPKPALSNSHTLKKKPSKNFHRKISKTGVSILEQTINETEVCNKSMLSTGAGKRIVHDIPDMEIKTDVNIKELPCDSVDLDNDLKQTSGEVLEQIGVEMDTDDVCVTNLPSHDSKLSSDNLFNNNCDSSLDIARTDMKEFEKKSSKITVTNVCCEKKSTQSLKDLPTEKTASKDHDEVLKSSPIERSSGIESHSSGMGLQNETPQIQSAKSSQSSESASSLPPSKLSKRDRTSLELRIQNLIKKYGCEYVLALLDS